METTACQPKVSRPLHLPRCSIRHGWLFSMSCQSRVRPGFTAVITIVGIYTTAPLFQTRRLVAGRQAAETLAAGHGCTGRRPPSLMMQQQTLPLLLPRQTDREREKGPWTEQPHGLTSNNLPPTRPPACLTQTQSNSPVHLILFVCNHSQVETEPLPEQQRGRQVRVKGKEAEWQIAVKDADRSLNRTLPAREISDILLDWRLRGKLASCISFLSHWKAQPISAGSPRARDFFFFFFN